jgi:hypothetical protein
MNKNKVVLRFYEKERTEILSMNININMVTIPNSKEPYDLQKNYGT